MACETELGVVTGHEAAVAIFDVLIAQSDGKILAEQANRANLIQMRTDEVALLQAAQAAYQACITGGP